MSTGIEWADEVWNPVTGCTPVSEGCENCYAERMSKRLAGRFGYPEDEPFKPGTFHSDKLDLPLRWRKPRRVFACSMGDLFHEEVSDEHLASVLTVMMIAKQHTFLVLTKRPERMREVMDWGALGELLPRFIVPLPARYLEDGFEVTYPAPNVWLGVSVENQETADERIPILLDTPAEHRFVSVEPLIAPVDLDDYLPWAWELEPGETTSIAVQPDWIIAGGESGPGARPMHPDWVRSLKDQCLDANAPFFFKQWGAWKPVSEHPDDADKNALVINSKGLTRGIASGSLTNALYTGPDDVWLRKVGKKKAGRKLDGQKWEQMPEELQG